MKGKVTDKGQSIDGWEVELDVSNDGLWGFERATITMVLPRETYDQLDIGDSMSVRIIRTETAAGESTHPLKESLL